MDESADFENFWQYALELCVSAITISFNYHIQVCV